jgi:hypothetical protein
MTFYSSADSVQVFDEEITTKWRNEIAQSGQDVTPKMMDWIIKELQWKAGVLKESGLVHVFDIGVTKSDTAISLEVQQALKEAVKPLEDIPSDQKDYHPGSDNKVVDLVHPSLFPVVYGRTRVLPDRTIGLDDCLGCVGQGDIVPVPLDEECAPHQAHYDISGRPVFSGKFQWLPCEVEFNESSCRIVSYINNAHPIHHKGLYEVIEKIISQSIPLWNKSLSTIRDSRITYDCVDYGEHPEPEPGPIQQEFEDADAEEEFWQIHQEWQDRTPIVPPEPESFAPPQESSSIDLPNHFSDSNLQIIVKLANIELNPENPTYEGGSWHIEGQLVRFLPTSAN